MSTRREINKILKAKNLTATSQYDSAGRSYDDYGWWTVSFDKPSTDFIRKEMKEPEFTGHIEFCEIDAGLAELEELPVREEKGQ